MHGGRKKVDLRTRSTIWLFVFRKSFDYLLLFDKKTMFCNAAGIFKKLVYGSYVGWNNFGLNLFTVQVEEICSLIFKAHTVQHNISQVSPLSLSLRWHESVQLCGQMSKCTYEVCVLRKFFFVYIPKYIQRSTNTIIDFV